MQVSILKTIVISKKNSEKKTNNSKTKLNKFMIKTKS